MGDKIRFEVINSTANVDKRLVKLFELVENDLLAKIVHSTQSIAPYKASQSASLLCCTFSMNVPDQDCLQDALHYCILPLFYYGVMGLILLQCQKTVGQGAAFHKIKTRKSKLCTNSAHADADSVSHVAGACDCICLHVTAPDCL